MKSYCNFLEEEIKKAQKNLDGEKADKLFRELNEIKKKEVEI